MASPIRESSSSTSVFGVDVQPPTPGTEDPNEGEGLGQSVEPGDDGETALRYLILCSDGLIDLYDDVIEFETWAHIVGEALVKAELDGSGNGSTTPTLGNEEAKNGQAGNPALALLRSAIGGDDPVVVSRMLTVERDGRWMDDTTIVVLPL